MNYFTGDELNILGIINDSVEFVQKYQLKDRYEWKRYVDVFRFHKDNDDFWRGEYFGKEMRGATLVYQITKDEKLYNTLTKAVIDLLSTQDEFGRITTYPIEKEFNGWDLWVRKYVLTGLQHYYRICKDEKLKEKIVIALCKHLDYVISKVGEGKIDITKTSMWWGCVNSCTILEPTMELYKMTKEKRYLDFAEYIISTGGSSDCNFIELDNKEGVYPYQYPVVKAYETMSFHEGLLAYYEVTGKKEYFDAVDKFIEKVNVSDITLIGCSGCTHELFDNSAIRQTEPAENVMQETCVTVTWIRIMNRLFFLTKDKKYIDRIELSGFNALYGSLNTHFQQLFERKKFLLPKVFDSYSPLYNQKRGLGVGGFIELDGNEYGGCCIAIGACGIAIMYLTAVMQDDDGILLNYFFNGKLNTKDLNNRDVELTFKCEYPLFTNCKILVNCENTAHIKLKVRNPYWAKSAKISHNNKLEKGYFIIEGDFKNGEEISLSFEAELIVHHLNNKKALTYGPITLAVDEQKDNINLENSFDFSDNPEYVLLQPKNKELLRISLTQTNGEKLLLTDYQSCGKYWNNKNSLISVWLK